MAINPNPNLPEDILFDIFSRLPIKSIGKFRCLSKPWRALLSDPKFIKFHLTRKTHKRHLLLISPSQSLHTISTFKDNDKTISKKVNLSNTWSAVVGSCNGLVLLVNQEEDLFLVNPITQEQVKVPDSPLSLSGKISFGLHGFGYDRCSDDYKIVTLSYSDMVGGWFSDTFVDVYSVKSGVWKRLEGSPYGIPFSYGAYVNGVIHWIVRRREVDYPSVIAAFDFADERFYEVPGPPIGVMGREYVFNKLVNLEGCLCMMDNSYTTYITSFWVLKEYGKEKSWMKYGMRPNYGWEIIKPLCFIGDDEVVLLCQGGYLLVYNFGQDGSTNMVVDGVCAMFTDGCTFTESLVSPSFGNEIERHVLI